MKGKLIDIQPRGMSTVYNYICLEDDDNLFSFPVEHRYHREILMDIGNPIGREIEYDNGVDPPYVRFIDSEIITVLLERVEDSERRRFRYKKLAV